MTFHPITSWASLLAIIAIAVSMIRVAQNLRRDVPRARMAAQPRPVTSSPPAEIVGLVPKQPYLRLVVDNTTSPPEPYDQELDSEWVQLRQRSLP